MTSIEYGKLYFLCVLSIFLFINLTWCHLYFHSGIICWLLYVILDLLPLFVQFYNSLCTTDVIYLESAIPTISHHMTLCNILSYHIKSNHIISYHITSYHILSHHTTPHHITTHTGETNSIQRSMYKLCIHPFRATIC